VRFDRGDALAMVDSAVTNEALMTLLQLRWLFFVLTSDSRHTCYEYSEPKWFHK
jgi:hypothetical protein